ncbi:GTPase Der [Paraburkholderia hiiakae]|uniref:GTPase Der n=1 Tax=Paraburkholderia hiiakae TaxID=1081782 RepID=A0ABM8P945_9BURK|nr:GTPase [Paraburkholderia hiiakae]CAD6559606.1 GTPase Der [Paraburkholderia hiiakae]
MNPFEQYKSLLEQAAPVAMRYHPDAEAIIAEWQERIQKQKIHVMLFGAYNAGKSTLINALVGREVAKAGDVPTTDVVDFHEWDGHMLLDTPGVNAPIAHEEISLEQLQRADLIVFVLRQEDQDASDIMNRIFELLEQNRPIFIVLNYEDGDPAHIEAIQARFTHMLLTYAGRRGFDKAALGTVPTILMNVKSACRARLENKAVLLEHSRFDVFMLRFREWLVQYNSEKQLLQQIYAGLERSLLQTVSASIVREATPQGDMQEVDAQIGHITREYRLLTNAASSKIRAELTLRRPMISEAIAQGGSRDTVMAALTQVGESVSEIVQTWLEKELKQNVKGRIGAALVADGLELPKGSDAGGSEFGNKMLDAALGGMKGVHKEHVQTLLEFGRKLKIPGLKGRWTKTLGRWADKAAPVIQVVAVLAEVAVDYYGEERDVQESQDRTLQRGQWLDEAYSQLYSGLMQSVTDVIAHVQLEDLQPVEARRSELRAKLGASDKDRSDWAALTLAFQDVAF